jgi:hypothetical protein
MNLSFYAASCLRVKLEHCQCAVDESIRSSIQISCYVSMIIGKPSFYAASCLSVKLEHDKRNRSSLEGIPPSRASAYFPSQSGVLASDRIILFMYLFS